MAQLVNVGLEDANGETASVESWVPDGGAMAFLLALKLATNAKISWATLSKPVDLVTITGNSPSGNNVETVKSKLTIRAMGVDLGSAAAPIAYAQVSIPAWVGDAYPYSPTSATGLIIKSLAGLLISETGVSMAEVKSVRVHRN